MSLGKLKGQGWDVHLCDGGMELRNRDVDLFANVAKVNNVYPVGLRVTPLRTALSACTTDGDDTEPTQGCDGGHGKGSRRHKGDAVDLAPTPGSPVFQDCGCISREWREWYGDYGPTGEEMRALHVSQRKQYTSRIRNSVVAQKNTWVAGPMQVKSASGRDYEYIVVDDYTRAVYTRPLRLRSEAPEAFKAFKAVAENESQKRMREIMTDNARQLCMER